MRSSFLSYFSEAGRNLTIAIVLGIVLGYVFSFVPFSLFPNLPPTSLTDYLVQFNYFVLQGWIVPIFTSMVVVYPNSLGALDVLFNAIAVLFLDRLFANTYTRRQYYLTFIITGVAGNVLSLLYGPALISFGASGGIFGLIGGAVTADYARNRRVNPSLLVWFVFIFIYSSIGSQVDLFAHLGGVVVGLIIGYLIGRGGSSGRYFF